MVTHAGRRASRDSWAAAALKALSRDGVEAVAVEPIAKQLGVTKGSFYWHFKDRGELLEAALALWERRGTTDIIESLRNIADPAERLRQLFQRVSDAGRAAPAHAALSSAGGVSVKRTLQRVARARLAFLEECYLELGMEPGVAHRRALLAYATYLGTMQIARDAPSELASAREREAFTEHVIDTLLGPRRTREKKG